MDTTMGGMIAKYGRRHAMKPFLYINLKAIVLNYVTEQGRSKSYTSLKNSQQKDAD